MPRIERLSSAFRNAVPTLTSTLAGIAAGVVLVISCNMGPSISMAGGTTGGDTTGGSAGGSTSGGSGGSCSCSLSGPITLAGPVTIAGPVTVAREPLGKEGARTFDKLDRESTALVESLMPLAKNSVTRVGLEPTTHGLKGRCSTS